MRLHLVAALLASTLAGSARAECPIALERRIVRGASMAELFGPGESIEVERGWYACHEPQRDDLVLVSAAGRQDPIVKIVRVVPGDRFALRPLPGGYSLEVNGRPLTTPKGEPYTFAERDARVLRLYEGSFRGVMPADTWFVFGTEPHGSLDSSRFGPVTREKLLGRVVHGIPRPQRLGPAAP